MATPSVNEKIIINFGWQGPSTWHGGAFRGGLEVGVVDLTFKNANTKISVRIPDGISPSTVQKLPFTCRRNYSQETHPDSLKVTIEQIRNLTIKAGIFEESPHRGPAIMDRSGRITQEKRLLRSDRTIKLEVPEELEIGQTYSLVVTSNDLSLSAYLLKKEERNPYRLDDEKQGHRNEFQSRIRNMGNALIREGVQNLNLASRNGAGVFDSSSTTADVFAHGIQGVIRAGQQMHPDIEVPHTRPSTSPSDLDKLTVAELQSLFENTFKKDKEFETQRMQAAMRGDVKKMNEILADEFANSQLLLNLNEALKRKGVSPLIPQSASFQATASQAAEAQDEALKRLQEECKVQ